MVDYTHKRALIVMAVSAAVTLGLCWLASVAHAQQCLQWSCQTVNASSANPIQYCTCILLAAPNYPAGGPPGSYASDASATDPLARWR